MPFNVRCSQCKKALAAPDKYAGRTVKCPGCATPIAIPAATNGDDDNPFGFSGGDGGALVASVGGKAVDPAGGRDDDVTPEVLELRREPGWASVIGGLNNIWIGSGLQVLGVTTVVLVLSLVASVGVSTAALATGDEGVRAGGLVSTLLIPGCMLVFVVGGMLLRLVGFCRCLSTPSGSGAWLLAVLALLCELAALAGAGVAIVGPYVMPLLGSLGNLASGLASLVGLVFLLIYLRQLGMALAARAIPARVLHFVLWLLIGGVVGFPALLGLGLGMIDVANSADRGSPLGYRGIPGIVLIILSIAGIPLTLLTKYLGTLSLAADEIGKRTGQGRRGRRS